MHVIKYEHNRDNQRVELVLGRVVEYLRTKDTDREGRNSSRPFLESQKTSKRFMSMNACVHALVCLHMCVGGWGARVLQGTQAPWEDLVDLRLVLGCLSCLYDLGLVIILVSVFVREGVCGGGAVLRLNSLYYRQ